jgi:hypothetical protein
MYVRVIDINTGSPIAGAYVYLNGYTGFTDTRGIAVINAPAGTYELRVTHANYDPLTTRVSISETSTVTVRLTPLVRLL